MEPAYTAWLGQPVSTADGEVYGTVDEVYADVHDNSPRWVEVAGSRGRSVLVPVAGLDRSERGFRTPLTAAVLDAAPTPDLRNGLSVDDEELLRQHFDGRPADGRADGPGAEQSDEVSVVRAEEQLRISTEVQPAGTVRLRKWVETETVNEQVVVHQERVRVEREPVTASNVDSTLELAQIGEAEYEIVLRDEQVVATKVTVPQEVVRLAKELVSETLVVEADLQQEHVDVDAPGDADDGLARQR